MCQKPCDHLPKPTGATSCPTFHSFSATELYTKLTQRYTNLQCHSLWALSLSHSSKTHILTANIKFCPWRKLEWGNVNSLFTLVSLSPCMGCALPSDKLPSHTRSPEKAHYQGYQRPTCSLSIPSPRGVTYHTGLT